MAFTAIELGHDYLVLTDHSPRLTVAHGLSPERLTRQLGVVAAVNEHLAGAGFTLLTGIEVDILDDGGLDQDDDLLARLDVRVASVHSKLKMEPAAMTRRMVAAVRNPRTNVLGHCTGRLVTGGRGPAPVLGVRRAGGLRGLRRARRRGRDQLPSRAARPAHRSCSSWPATLGCLFSIDSDAHAPGQLDFLVYGCERAEQAGIDPERIVNTWPKERLLAWANR